MKRLLVGAAILVVVAVVVVAAHMAFIEIGREVVTLRTQRADGSWQDTRIEIPARGAYSDVHRIKREVADEHRPFAVRTNHERAMPRRVARAGDKFDLVGDRIWQRDRVNHTLSTECREHCGATDFESAGGSRRPTPRNPYLAAAATACAARRVACVDADLLTE